MCSLVSLQRRVYEKRIVQPKLHAIPKALLQPLLTLTQRLEAGLSWKQPAVYLKNTAVGDHVCRLATAHPSHVEGGSTQQGVFLLLLKFIGVLFQKERYACTIVNCTAAKSRCGPVSADATDFGAAIEPPLCVR